MKDAIRPTRVPGGAYAHAIGGGAASLLLFAVFFTPWWLAGIAISTALIIGALRVSPL